MNVERLHLILTAVQPELNNNVALLNKVVNNLNQQVSQPQQGSHQQAVAAALAKLHDSLASADSNTFSPGWSQALDEIGVHDLTGMRLHERTSEIFARNQITPTVALEELRVASQQLSEKKQAVDQLIAGLPVLGIGQDELDPGRAELGMLVPREEVSHRLDDFEKELHEMGLITMSFVELVTGRSEPVRLRSLASTDYGVYIESGPKVLLAIAVAIERLMAAYDKLLGIRLKRRELKESGVSDERLKGVDEHAESIMTDCVDELEVELVEEYNGSDARKNELRTSIRLSLNKIANRIDRGFSFEVRAQASPDNADEGREDAAPIQQITEIAARVRFPALEGRGILELPESNKGDGVEGTGESGRPA